MFRSLTIGRAQCTFAAISTCTLFAVSAHAERALTSDEVARHATLTSPSAEEKRQEVEAARAQFDKTFTDFFPRATFSASYTRLSKVDNPSLGNVVVAPGAAAGPIDAAQPLVAAPLGFESLQNQTVFSSSLSVPLSDYVLRLVQARQASGAQLGAAEQSLKGTLRKTAYDARALYYDWVQSELERSVAQKNLDLGHEHLARMQALASADSASEADVARVEATVASSELLLEEAKNLAQLQRQRLRITMHDSGASDYAIGEDLSIVPGAALGTDDLEALTRHALVNRPELKALALQTQGYEKQVTVARSRAFPRLDLTAQSQIANPNSRYFPQEDKFHSSWQVGIQLSYSPFDTASASADAAAARAKARASGAQEKELLDAVRTEVTDAVLSHRNAVAGLTSSAKRVQAAETSYRARYQLFLADKATTVELTEAQTELFNARLDDARAKVAIRLARVRLAYVTGEEH